MITTNYITEIEFRDCSTNNLSNPPPFSNNNKTINYNTNYDKTSSILKVLAIDDTFHDFSKDRNGYNASKFNDEGPANFLLTGNFFTGDNISTYKNTLNYEEYKSASGKFETKVATSIDIVKGLQPAEIAITYDDIIGDYVNDKKEKIENITIDASGTILINNKTLEKTIQLSNGSIHLCLNNNNPLLKNLDQSRLNFSDYIFYIYDGNYTKIEKAKYKISSFIRWYLHSDNFENKLPSESMKILSDAGISFLGDFFSVKGSMVTPFVAIPCFLDSASTSVSLLDPNIDIAFETITEDYVIPIISNYFSCDKYFMCYLLNPKSSFDKDNLYNFSVIFLNIDNIPDSEKTIKNDIIFAVRKTNSIFDSDYIKACTNIKNYIYTYPGLIARYYFGEVKKNASDNDDSSCGTCGAGVPYLGKVLDTLIKARTNIKNPGINGLWTSPAISNLKKTFNDLKNLGSLNSRIPIADARILKLFCDLQANSSNTYCSIQQSNLDSLFKILADYKRTGDYQQSYTVLKQILSEGTNTGCYTFCSGDELSTLVGRLLGVPSIYQIANGSTCSLYRCNLYKAPLEERVRLKNDNDIGIIGNYIEKITYKLELTLIFVKNYYNKICQLREQLSKLLKDVIPSNNSTTTETNTNETNTNETNTNETNTNETSTTLSNEKLFIALKYYNAITILDEILKNCNNLITNETNTNETNTNETNTNEEYINQLLVKLNNIFSQYKNINLNKSNNTSLEQLSKNISECLVDIAKIEEGKMFEVFIYIQENFPLIFINQDSDFFEPLSNTENTTTPTFKRTTLGLNVKNGNDNTKDSKILNENVRKITSNTSIRSSRNINVKQKELEIQGNIFVNNYNNFISSFNSSIISENTISQYGDFNSTYINNLINKISNYTNNSNICNETLNNNIQNILEQLIKKLKKENLPDELSIVGKKRLISQTGGTNNNTQNNDKYQIQKDNRLCIYYEIQKLVLNITNKCAIYMSNVSKQYFENNNNISILELLNNISKDYETDNFCAQLLFEQNDDISLDDDNNGFVIALKLLAEKYTYSDITINEESNNSNLLTVNDMLDELNLPYIKLIIILLAWAKNENIQLGCNLITLDYASINITTDYNTYSTIYNYLTSNYSDILSIYSILCFGLINYSYYGSKSICFNTTYCNDFVGPYFGLNLSQGYVNLNKTPKIFSQEGFKIISDSIYSVISTKLGLVSTATGVKPRNQTNKKRLLEFKKTKTNKKLKKGGKTRKQFKRRKQTRKYPKKI